MSHTFLSWTCPSELKGPNPIIILLFTCAHGPNNQSMESQTPDLDEKTGPTGPMCRLLEKPHTEALLTQKVENPQKQDFCLTILQIYQSRREGTVARGPHPQRILRLTTVDWTRPQTGVAVGKANAMFSEGPARLFQLLWWACARGHGKGTAGTSPRVLKEGTATPVPV